jgi:hypothetical protein
MSTELRDQRVPLLMTASEVRAVDDWSFARRIRSRGEAIRTLIQLGLQTSPDAPAATAQVTLQPPAKPRKPGAGRARP